MGEGRDEIEINAQGGHHEFDCRPNAEKSTPPLREHRGIGARRLGGSGGLTLGAPPQKAGAICSSVEAKNPRLYDDGRKIAGNALADDCGGLAKVTATLHWGHAVPGFDWLWRPHASKTIRTPGSAFHAFGSGTARCNPGIYYTEVKGYNRAGEVVTEDNSELVNTGCNPDNW
jgi:hypothetical protein